MALRLPFESLKGELEFELKILNSQRENMDATRMKISLVVSIIAIVLMALSLFGTWYVWESQSEYDHESRELTRDWEVNRAVDSYRYESTDSDNKLIHSGGNSIRFNKEELTYKNGQFVREEKFGSDYQNSVRAFYRTMFLAIIGIGILLVFTSGVGLSFLRNLDRSNLYALGGIAVFFCLLPPIILAMTLPSAMESDNQNYSVGQRPASDDYDNLSRYEIEGSYSRAKADSLKGEANVSFENHDYKLSWHPGIAFYLSISSGVLCAVSVVMIALTNREFFNRHETYHPKRIPAPALVHLPGKAVIPVVIAVALILLQMFVLLSPWWHYEYHGDYARENTGEAVGTANLTMVSCLQGPELKYNYDFSSADGGEKGKETSHVKYTEREQSVINLTDMFLLSGMGLMIFSIPAMFMMFGGRLDLKNGMPLLVLPAVMLFISPLYFMVAFSDVVNDEFNAELTDSSSDISAEDIGFYYDGSFQGSAYNNTTINRLNIKSRVEWGPEIGWYSAIASGLLYLIVPALIFVWRRELLEPDFDYRLYRGGAGLNTGEKGGIGYPDGAVFPPAPSVPVSASTPTVYAPTDYANYTNTITAPRTLTGEQGLPQSAQILFGPAAQPSTAAGTGTTASASREKSWAIICPHCGESFTPPRKEGKVFCPFCGTGIDLAPFSKR